jgi:hypothetical protein
MYREAAARAPAIVECGWGAVLAASAHVATQHHARNDNGCDDLLGLAHNSSGRTGMKRTLLLAIACVTALAMAAPASANVPRGRGLMEPFPATCDGMEIMVIQTRGGGATAWATTGEHVVLQSLSFETGGQVVFSKSLGVKAGLSTFTCTAQLEEDGVMFDVTVRVAIVPPA